MKMFVAALAAATVLAGAAMANNQTGGGPGSANAGLTGGATGGAAAATARSGASALSGASSSVSGVRGGAGGAGGAGGGGGKGGKGGTSNVSVNNSIGNGGGGSGGGSSRAPDVFLPSIGGGGMDCPTVGFGAAGSGLGGGGGFGPSWISSDCNHRKVAELLSHLYGEAVARAYVEKNIEGVSEAVKASTTERPAYQHPAWCVASNGRWLRNLDECGEDPR